MIYPGVQIIPQQVKQGRFAKKLLVVRYHDRFSNR